MKRPRRKQRRERRNNTGSEDTAGQPNTPDGVPGWIRVWAPPIAAVLAIAAFAVTKGSWAAGEVAGLFDEEAPGQLELRHVAAYNSEPAFTSRGTDLVQTTATTPRVDLMLRNTGEEPVLLTKARVTIVDSAMIIDCPVPIGGTNVPVSNRYAIRLSPYPVGAERIVERDLHDEIMPGEVVRPLILFRSGWSPMSRDVFALSLKLLTDRGQTIDAGDFVFGVPGPVSRSGSSLPETTRALDYAAGRDDDLLVATWCQRHNLTELRRVLAHEGDRTAEIASLSRVGFHPDWQRRADQRPPREAAAALLAPDLHPYGPLYAVTAAKQTGDTDFVHDTRQRAAARLAKRTEESLASDYPYSADDYARTAHRILPSPANRRLLERAKAATREADARIGTAEAG